MKSKQIHGDFFISIFIFIFIGILIPIAIKLPSSSSIFPIMLIVGLGLLNIILLANSLKKSKEAGKGEIEANIIKLEDIKSPLFVFVLTVVYAFLFAKTNYFISSAIYMIALMKYFKIKSLKIIIITTIVFNLVMYIGFSKLLNVPLI